MKTYIVKAFFADVAHEDCPEVQVRALDSEDAIARACMFEAKFCEFMQTQASYYEFIEAVEA